MGTKYTKEFISNELNKRGFYLICDDYTTMKRRYDIEDNNGYKYNIPLRDLLFKNKIPHYIHKSNPFTIDNIRQYLHNNNITTQLLSTEYVSNTSLLEWQCGCGNKFIQSWDHFLLGSHTCRTCAVRKSGKYDWDAEWQLIERSFAEQGYTLLSIKDEYCGDRTMLKYLCPKHKDKGVLQVSWNSRKAKGSGCKYCANEYIGRVKRLDEDKIRTITEKAGYIYDHVEYRNGKGYIYYLCPHHLTKGLQYAAINVMRNGKRVCGVCNGHNRTHDDFVIDIAGILPNVEIVSKYTTAKERVHCKCKIDGYEWDALPDNLYKAEGCRKCSDLANAERRFKGTELFRQELQDKYNGKISLISTYLGARDKVTCRCNIDNTVFDIIASTLVHSATMPCPTCRGKNIHDRCVKSNEQFLSELQIVNPNIVPLEEYKDDHSYMMFRCVIHNYEWLSTPNKLLHRKTGCPKCCLYHNERVICDLLDQWGYRYEVQKHFDDCKDQKLLPFDIFMIDYGIAIEYDGEQHYYPIRRGKQSDVDAQRCFDLAVKHDNIKNDYCFNHNIPLIRIPYWENKNIESFLFDALVQYGAIEEI